MSAEIRPGQRVRVTIEGPLYDLLDRGMEIGLVDYRVYVPTVMTEQESEWGGGLKVEVEVLPDPEPRWQPGDVVLDANGSTWQYLKATRGWADYLGNTVLPRALPRPLTLVVRDGKPVTP